MIAFWLLLALAAGLVIPLQPAINAQLRRHAADSSLVAALISFAVGMVVLLAVAAAVRVKVSALSTLSAAPWWAWTGGILGAFFVTITILLTPRLGVGLLVACVVVGQLIGSLGIDHFGIAGVQKRPVNAGRLLGVGLMVLGMIVVHFSTRVRPATGETDVPPGAMDDPPRSRG